MNISNIIIITILILVLIWVLNRFFFRTDVVYDMMCDANELAGTEDPDAVLNSYFVTNKNIISNKDFNENNTSNFMLSLWFYIDNWGNAISNEKNILYMSTKAKSKTVEELQENLVGISSKVDATSDGVTPYKNLNICLDKYENNLFIDIETYSDAPGSEATGATTFTRYIVKNIPIQKWNNLTLSIDTRTFDVYLDGKLRNSFILHGIYKSNMENNKRKNMYLGNLGGNNMGFEGFVTRIRFRPNSINPQEAYNIYRDGINSSLAKTIFNKYGLKVSFMEYGTERGAVTL
jgi:hypothetical protein